MPIKSKNSQICIITITGCDQVGIIAKVANALAKVNVNIVDVNQKIMEAYFVMTMAVDISGSEVGIAQINRRLARIASAMELRITFQDETIFKMMHRI